MNFQPVKLPQNVLPTNKNVIEAIIFENKNNKLRIKSAIPVIVRQLILVWKKASLSHLSEPRVKKKVLRYHAKYTELLYCHKTRPCYLDKLRKFKVIEIFAKFL